MFFQDIKSSIKEIGKTEKLSKLAKIIGLDWKRDFVGIDLSDEDLSYDIFTHTDLSGVNFSNANLSGFNFFVPYQRRRVLASRDEGERPFNLKSPRYNEYYRAILGFPQFIWQAEVRRFIPQEQKPKTGSPALYLDLARSLTNRANVPPRISAMNISLDKVPYRKTTAG